MRPLIRSITFVIMGTAFVACGESDHMVLDPTSAALINSVLTVDSAGFVEEAHLFVHGCETEGTGRIIGDQVADFTFTSCTGEPVRLHDYCGRRSALWLVGSAGWCGACISHFPDVVRETRALRAQGLESFIFVGETENSQAVTLEWCQEFAAGNNVDPAMMIFDESAADGLQSLWNFIAPNAGGGGSIGLPWEAVLDPYDMTFYWDSSIESDPLQPINELLAD
jgi:hypothetical protein